MLCNIHYTHYLWKKVFLSQKKVFIHDLSGPGYGQTFLFFIKKITFDFNGLKNLICLKNFNSMRLLHIIILTSCYKFLN